MGQLGRDPGGSMFAFAISERFDKLDRKDRDRLEALSKLDEFSAGDEILVAGRHSECIYLIASGGVDLRAKTKSGDLTLAQLGPGDLFGEVEPFAEMPEGVRHVAREGTIVRAIEKNPLRHELLAHRELATALLAVYARSISEKLRAANDVAVRLSPRPGISRPPPPESGGGGRAPHLSEEEAAWLAVLGQELEVAPGETVVEEDEKTRSFYVVQRGELEVRKHLGPGENRTLAGLGPRVLDDAFHRLRRQAFARILPINLVRDLRESGGPIDVVKAHHADDRVRPGWHHTPAHRGPGLDLREDAGLGPCEWTKGEPCSVERRRHSGPGYQRDTSQRLEELLRGAEARFEGAVDGAAAT